MPAQRRNSEITREAIERVFVPQLRQHARERMTASYSGEENALKRLRAVVGDDLDKAIANAARRDDPFRVDKAPPRDLFDWLELAHCRLLYEAEFETLLGGQTGAQRDVKRLRREWMDKLQIILNMRNELAHPRESDLSYDDAESALNPLTRFLERLGHVEAAQSAKLLRSELTGSPRSVRASIEEENERRNTRARPRWVAVAISMTCALAGAALAWHLDTWPFGRTNSADPARPVPPEPPVPQGEPAGMVRVRAGAFGMGDDHEPKSRPAHRVTLTTDFWIDKTEVTVGDYAVCVSSGVCSPPSLHGPYTAGPDADRFRAQCNSLRDATRVRHPVNCVDQSQAITYCAFAKKRLPNEAEWEYAARGSDGRTYPWGEAAPSCRLAVAGGLPGPCGDKTGTFEVGSAPGGASPFGAVDMAGNVWEWVVDGWSTYDAAPVTNPRPVPRAREGVLRGGDWAFSPPSLKAASRIPYDATTGHVGTGFRCAKSIEGQR